MELIKEFMLLALGVTTDEHDKTLTIFKVVETLTLQTSKEDFTKNYGVKLGDQVALPLSYFLVSSWSTKKAIKTDVNVDVVTKLIDPNGKELNKNTTTLEIPAKAPRIKFNIGIQGQIYTVNGAYRYAIDIVNGSKVVASGYYDFVVEIKFNNEMNKQPQESSNIS